MVRITNGPLIPTITDSEWYNVPKPTEKYVQAD